MAHTPKTPAQAKPLKSLADLTPDPLNANRGTRRGQALLAQSLQTLGAGRSILSDRQGRVVAGNKTLAEAQHLNLPVRIVETEGEELVVVQRTDLDLDEDGRARQLALYDNRTTELNLDWDPDLLRQQMADGVDLSALWNPDELERLLGHGLGGGRAEDDAVVPLRETTIEPGDLFELGDHRVICGDATDGQVVATLLNGETPAVMVTDPPYGVEYDPAWRPRAGLKGRYAVGAVANDDQADWSSAFVHFQGDVAYVWHGALHAPTVAEALAHCGFDIRSQIIWVKPHFVLGRSDYHWRHEPCWYAVRQGKPSGWRGDRAQSTVWSIPHLSPFGGGAREDENRPTGHATQKPVRLFELPILHHTAPGDIIFDPFVGSGTAVIAGHKTGRRCLAIELNPTYIQAAVDRWEAYTGEVAIRHETHQPRGSTSS